MRKAMSKPLLVPAHVLATLLQVFVLSGCLGTGPTFQERMDAWVGAPDDRLASHFGAPHAVYTTSTGARVLSYHYGKISTSGDGTRADPTRVRTHNCDVHFTLRDNRVTEVNWDGIYCFQLVP